MQDAGCRIQTPGARFPVAGLGVRSSASDRLRCRVPGARCQVPGTRNPVPGACLQKTRTRGTQDAGCRMQTRCARFPVAGLGLRCSVFSPRRRTGSGAGYQVPGTRDPEPGTRRLSSKKPAHGVRKMQDANPCARFPVAGLGLRCSVFSPRHRTGSGAGYQVPVPDSRHPIPGPVPDNWYLSDPEGRIPSPEDRAREADASLAPRHFVTPFAGDRRRRTSRRWPGPPGHGRPSIRDATGYPKGEGSSRCFRKPRRGRRATMLPDARVGPVS
jgi:hypothetical protein